MKGLIIETSTKTPLLASTENGELIASHILEGGKKLTEALFPLLEELLKEGSPSYIAAGTGPGSFIGMRTAATIAKSLAFGLKIPLIEFPTPFAFFPKDFEGPFAFCGDAKMGKSYLLTGEKKGSTIVRLDPFTLHSKEELEKKRPDALSLTTPNLSWLAHYAHSEFLLGHHIEPNALTLAYLSKLTG